MIQLFTLLITILIAAYIIPDMAKASTTDPTSGSQHLMAILNALPSSNFQHLEEDGGIAVDSAFWAGILYEGKSGKFKTDSIDENSGFLAFSDHSESGFDRFILKVYAERGLEVVLWSEEAKHDGSLESRVRLWDRGLSGEWKDCTFRRMGKPMLTNLYPALEIEEDIPLQAHYRFEADQLAFSTPALEFSAEVHQQMLRLVEFPELHYQFKNGRFVKQPYEISQIESYFYRLPDDILLPLISYLGIALPSPGQINPSFRKMMLHDSDRFRDRALDPANGYLALGTNTDGGGKFFAMTYWKQSSGEHLVGVVTTDWSLSCESGILRFLRPLDKGWEDVTDEVAPSLALGDLPWLTGKNSLSGDELKIQAFDISLPREGKDIRLVLDICTLEDALHVDVKTKGIGYAGNFEERVLSWQDGVFEFVGD
jgi:hypothetical protein